MASLHNFPDGRTPHNSEESDNAPAAASTAKDTPNSRHVASLAKKLEKSIIFPQYSHRLLPACDPADRRDSSETITHSANTMEDEFDSIVANAQTHVTQQYPSTIELRETNKPLAPHRFGSLAVGNEAEGMTDSYSDHGSWGSDEFLTSGTDSWSPEDVDSRSDVSLDSCGKADDKDTVDAPTLNIHTSIEVNSPDPITDTIFDLSKNPRPMPGNQNAFDDFVEVKFNPVKHPPPSLPPRPDGLSREQQKRRHIFDNLISTENNYVASLTHLVKDYDEALLNVEPRILSDEERRSVFFMLRHLLQIHQTFQISLHDAALKWDTEESVAMSFTACFSRATVRRVYAAYINNYDDAMERLNHLERKNKAFANFLRKQQRNNIWRLALNGLMVKPIQRFPQFILLLQDLLKQTDENHPQFYHLQRAVSDVQTLTNFLNEQKREAVQKSEARNLMRDLHVQFVDLSKDQKRTLRLLDTVRVENTRYSETGTLVGRTMENLALFNIMVICYVDDQSLGKPKMKWSSTLSNTTVKSRNITPDMKVSVRKDSLGSTVVYRRNRALSVVDESARQRLEDLQTMMHDHALLMQISGLAAILKLRYRGFNELKLDALCTKLQRLIQQKDDENRLTDSSYLELQIAKSNENQIARRLVYNLNSPSDRNAWVDRFMRQKLSQEEWNLPSWTARGEACDPNDPFGPCINTPLFIRSATVDISRNLGEVNCAVPVCLVYGTILKRLIWCCHDGGGVTIFSLYTHKPLVVQNFECPDLLPGASFWCVEVVPGAIDSPDSRHQADMVWAGTNTGQIFAFSLLEQERQRPFLRMKVDSAVVSLCYAADRVFAGLHNGLIVIYEREARGFWYKLSPIRVGQSEVVKMVAPASEEGAVLIACDDMLFKITPKGPGNGFACDPIPMEGNDYIQDFVVGGQTAWVAFQNSLILRLIHLKTHELLQTIDLQPTIDVVDDKNRDFDESVTCLTITKRMLLIGTRVGHLCKVPLQQAVPVSSGPCSVAYHKHHGAVRFIVSFQNMVERLVHAVACEEEEIDLEEGEQEDIDLDIEDEGNEIIQNKCGLRSYERKPSLDTNSSKRLSLTPLKNKWLSNPNLLLSLQQNDTEDDLYGNLMVTNIDIEAISEEGSVHSTPVSSRKTSADTTSEIVQPVDPNINLEQRPPVQAPSASDAKMWLEDNLIITGGLGYYDLKNRIAEEMEQEPCLNCWCE